MIGGGEATVGVLLASTAVGAFLAGLSPGRSARVRRQGAAVVWSVMGWGASIAGFRPDGCPGGSVRRAA